LKVGGGPGPGSARPAGPGSTPPPGPPSRFGVRPALQIQASSQCQDRQPRFWMNPAGPLEPEVMSLRPAHDWLEAALPVPSLAGRWAPAGRRVTAGGCRPGWFPAGPARCRRARRPPP
jgi:hypothetical protein